jgi:uncharacterized membrane protein
MRNDPGHWKGLFYVNSKDPRVIVPKMNPALGWTLNFGNVYTYLILLAIVSIIVISQYFI